jgi:hypothetical protein
MALTAIDVLPYLRERGLVEPVEIVDGEIAVIDATRRNSNFRVQRRTGAGYLLKQASADGSQHTLYCEAAAYGFFQADARAAALRAWLPQLYRYVAEDALLVFQLVEGAESLWQYCEARPSFPPSVGPLVGRALAELHRSCRAAELAGDARLQMLPRAAPFILWAHKPGPEILATISPANYRTLAILQNEGELARHLDRLRKDWRAEALVHGDVKSDNLLVVAGPPERLVLVDWELAHFGDPAWDVGNALHDLLGFWIRSMPIARGLEPAQMMAGARHPLATLQPAMRGLWLEYRAAAPVDAAGADEFLLRCTRYCAARLAQNAYESSQGQAALSNQAVMMLQIAANVFADPARAAVALFGIPLAS